MQANNIVSGPIHYEFDNPGVIFTTFEIVGRGVRFICEQLNGRKVYSCTEAARKKLVEKYGATYTNSMGDTSKV